MTHLFFGDNAFAKQRALSLLVATMQKKHGSEVVERFEAESLEPQHLRNILQGASLFSADKLVVISDASKNKPLWLALEQWTETPVRGTELVLLETAPDRRTKTFKLLQKHANIKEYKQLTEPEAVQWLMQAAKERVGSLDLQAARQIVARAGVDQWRLSNELDKLLAYGVSSEAIDILVEPTMQANAFALLDAVLHKKGADVKKYLASAKLAEDPYMLFGLLNAQLLQLAALVYGAHRTTDEIAKLLGTHPFPLKKMTPLAKQTSPKELKEIIGTIAVLDNQLKSTGLSPWLLLEQALLKIAYRS